MVLQSSRCSMTRRWRGFLAGLIVIAGVSLGAEAKPLRVYAASAAKVTRLNYGGRPALSMSDGKTEAIIVPAIGRVMYYGFVGGPNYLWNNQNTNFKPDEWKNWGGDKTWPAPQNYWPVMSGKGWPLDPTWDGLPHQAEVLQNRRVRMASAVSPGFGARIVREFYFNEQGELVIEQAVEKQHGAPLMISLWSVTQIAPPDAIFLPITEQSVYKNNFHWIARPKAEGLTKQVSPALLQVRPTPNENFKIGTDSPAVGAAAVWAGVAFVQRAAKPGGQYPDGALGNGFPVELWNNGNPDAYYNELELLSPLRPARAGSRWQYTVRWSLHRLPSKDVNAPELHAVMDKLLQANISG